MSHTSALTNKVECFFKVFSDSVNKKFFLILFRERRRGGEWGWGVEGERRGSRRKEGVVEKKGEVLSKKEFCEMIVGERTEILAVS